MWGLGEELLWMQGMKGCNAFTSLSNGKFSVQATNETLLVMRGTGYTPSQDEHFRGKNMCAATTELGNLTKSALFNRPVPSRICILS